MTTAGDHIREFCTKQGLTQAERDYLLGVVGEAVLAERGRCLRVVRAQPLHPGTQAGLRQRWVIDQIAAAIESGAGGS
jgi:hypothetical protein